MNEVQVRTVEQVREVLQGTQALEFRGAQDDEGRYAWIQGVLQRLAYRQLKRGDRGVVRAYLQHLSGYSRAQITRLVSRWLHGERLSKQYRAPEHAFARRYTVGPAKFNPTRFCPKSKAQSTLISGAFISANRWNTRPMGAL